jgi:DNA-binding response OmpR family regulator
MSSKMKVLIVEDEMPMAMLMVNVLTRVGCHVEAVCTGKKAMELARDRKFDVITLDISLPDADGFQICTQLKERHISRRTPIIFVSASPREQDKSESMKRGAVDYITKPFDVTDFIYRVIHFANTNRSSDPDEGQSNQATYPGTV